MVRMCAYSFLFTLSTIAASVVDLPEPVGPVTRIRPCGWLISSLNTLGQARSSSVQISVGMVRNTAIWTLEDLRSEEHTSELQSLRHLVCRLLLEKKNHRLYVTLRFS